MKQVWKYIFYGLCVILAQWIFVSLVGSIFTGLSQSDSITLGVGFFLAFEMVICTGLILSKNKK